MMPDGIGVGRQGLAAEAFKAEAKIAGELGLERPFDCLMV